ncbi:MAG: hypothetical protein ACRD1X_05195 [Vicinamibacteria bacterium]
MKQAQPSRFPHSPRQTRSREDGPTGMLAHFFKRELGTDVVVRGEEWLKKSGVQQQLEFEGYQLRWVNRDRLDVNFADGWNYVTVPHYLWWTKRVRRRHGPQDQYLLRRVKSLRGSVG